VLVVCVTVVMLVVVVGAMVVVTPGDVLVVVVQPGISDLMQPASGSQVSIVHGFPSSQVKVRQFALQGWQGPLAVPLSQVSGYSTRPLPHTGHGGRQPGGWFDGAQMGWKSTSP